jgi:exopolyphosphatase/guanosine-5'-triphosphate,3'-diphosphate pyrophosphatase
MRDASNQKEVIEYIKKKSGIQIEVISGKKEARLISGRSLPGGYIKEEESLFVDVGGGSTELSLRRGSEEQTRASFNLGTLRLLSDVDLSAEWERMQTWLENLGMANSAIPIIGSGGNITRVFKLKVEHPSDFYITTDSLREFYQEIKDLSLKERMIRYNFNPDRADVIVPAIEIFLNIIDFTGSKIIYVPKSGLSDGMVRTMYRDYIAGDLDSKNQ